MLQRFPGRFLEEIDGGMDWYRFMRAAEAEHIERIEDKYARFTASELKAKDLSSAEWEAVKAHDELMERYGANGDESA